MHHRWLDLYFVWKTKMIQKTKDCLPVVITLFNIARRSELKDKTFCQKEKCRSWALGLVTLSSFTKRDRNKTYSSRTSMVIYCETVIFFWIKKGKKLYSVIFECVSLNIAYWGEFLLSNAKATIDFSLFLNNHLQPKKHFSVRKERKDVIMA